jgi:hypothetical protein
MTTQVVADPQGSGQDDVGKIQAAIDAAADGDIIQLGEGVYYMDTDIPGPVFGAVQAATATSVTLEASASGTDDEYNGRYVIITGGTGIGQRRKITDYNGTTKVATVEYAWTTIPDTTSGYKVAWDFALIVPNGEYLYYEDGFYPPFPVSNQWKPLDVNKTVTFIPHANGSKLYWPSPLDNIASAITNNGSHAVFDGVEFEGLPLGGTIRAFSTFDLLNCTLKQTWIQWAVDNKLVYPKLAKLSSGDWNLDFSGDVVKSKIVGNTFNSPYLVIHGNGQCELEIENNFVYGHGEQAGGWYSFSSTNYIGVGPFDAIDVNFSRSCLDQNNYYSSALQKGWDTAQAGAAAAITLAADAVAEDDFYNDFYIEIMSGTGAGQVRKVADYDGTTKVVTVDSAWDTQPDNTSVYFIYWLKSPNSCYQHAGFAIFGGELGFLSNYTIRDNTYEHVYAFAVLQLYGFDQIKDISVFKNTFKDLSIAFGAIKFINPFRGIDLHLNVYEDIRILPNFAVNATLDFSVPPDVLGNPTEGFSFAQNDFVNSGVPASSGMAFFLGSGTVWPDGDLLGRIMQSDTTLPEGNIASYSWLDDPDAWKVRPKPFKPSAAQKAAINQVKAKAEEAKDRKLNNEEPVLPA